MEEKKYNYNICIVPGASIDNLANNEVVYNHNLGWKFEEGWELTGYMYCKNRDEVLFTLKKECTHK